MWVPPFPNDSGSAIGVACCEMIKSTKISRLDWSVFCGPLPKPARLQSGWKNKEFTIAELAELLHRVGEPVVIISDRAEAGPRALGCRSIIAPPTSLVMKNWLNRLKDREEYRPVAPICLESEASKIFNPGTPDPYMLFDHKVRDNWKDKIPAVVHLDGTARLQTVSESESIITFKLLTAYEKLSGVPVLCNTSANYNGKGFFPDVKSVMEWGQVNFIWSEEQIYYRESFDHLINKNEVNEEPFNAINI